MRFRSTRALYRLILRHQLTAGRATMVAAVAAVVLLLSIAVRSESGSSIDPVRDAVRFLNAWGLTIMVPFISLLFASSSLGDLVDDRTLVYVWLKPTPRWVLATAAAAAATTVALPVTVVPLALAALVANGEPGVVGGTAVAVAVGVAAYSGIFTWLGLRVRRALVWGIAYILLWEGFVVRASDSAAKLAVRAYTRSVLSEFTGVGLEQATLSLTVAIVVPLAAGAAAVVLTARRLARTAVD